MLDWNSRFGAVRINRVRAQTKDCGTDRDRKVTKLAAVNSPTTEWDLSSREAFKRISPP